MTRLPDDRDLEPMVRSWMRDDPDRPADRNRQIGRIMGRVDETRQRRGPWRFLPFGRARGRIDTADDDLYVTSRGGFAGSVMAAVAVIALVFTGLSFLLSRPGAAPLAPGAAPSPSHMPQATAEPADLALTERLAALWSGQPLSLDDVRGVYAEDAVHTALWQDEVERFVGQEEIRQRIRLSRAVIGGEWIRLPDARRGEHRYLGGTTNLGGIACVLWIRDARVSRHDCILPQSSTWSTPEFQPASPESLELWATIKQDFRHGWADGDREAIERVVSPDIVHRVAMDDHDYTLRGIDMYMDVMAWGSGVPEEQAPPIALAAPEGEARWTDFSGVGGGSLCTFWARDGLIVRHDCVVPTSIGVTAPLATSDPTDT